MYNAGYTELDYIIKRSKESNKILKEKIEEEEGKVEKDKHLIYRLKEQQIMNDMFNVLGGNIQERYGNPW